LLQTLNFFTFYGTINLNLSDYKGGGQMRNKSGGLFSCCLFLVVIFLIIFVGSATAQENDEKKILLRAACAYPASLTGLGTAPGWIADRIDTLSGGSLKMKVYQPGKLVKTMEILGTVSGGKINAGFAASGYWVGTMPAAAFFTSVPFGPSPAEFLSWMYHGNGMKLYQEMYDKAGYNVKVFPCTLGPPETAGWYRKEINSVEDLKGLKMRFFGLGALVMQKLGVNVTSSTPGGVFSSLEKNVIDATEYSMPSVDAKAGFYKVAKYNYFPGWHQQSVILELLLNKDVWKKMSPRQKMCIETLCQAATSDIFALSESLQGIALKENVEKHGVEMRYWSDEMLEKFKKAWLEVVKEQCAKDAFFKKVWDDLSAFRANYALWGAYGFLPRPKP
jgi:TRAP-type mannitol/chloroaromatic compound transport system substrate-binding protein